MPGKNLANCPEQNKIWHRAIECSIRIKTRAGTLAGGGAKFIHHFRTWSAVGRECLFGGKFLMRFENVCGCGEIEAGPFAQTVIPEFIPWNDSRGRKYVGKFAVAFAFVAVMLEQL